MEQEYKKYSQFMTGQFMKTSKKAKALFIGRSIQLLTESVKKYEQEKKLRMDTLRFAVSEEPLTNEDGADVKGWQLVIVAYEVGSMDPFTEEDRKAMEERKKQREEQRRKAEEEVGEAAMEAMEREMGIIPPAASEIQ